MARLVPKNWQDFQHYKDRSPPWIRLHKSLLDNYEFQCLPVASRALAPMLWLVCSESSDLKTGSIDYSARKLAFRLRMTEQEINDAIIPLIDNGFFVMEQDASDVLADRKQDAVPETETETETETESYAMSGKPDPFPQETQKSKNLKTCASEILSWMNRHTGRNFQAVEANTRLLVARLKEGASPEYIRRVVYLKNADWGTDPKMANYIRPATLFNREKFWQYHGELVPLSDDQMRSPSQPWNDGVLNG